MSTFTLGQISTRALFITLLRELAEADPSTCKATIAEVYQFNLYLPDAIYSLSFSESYSNPDILDSFSSGLAIGAITHAVRKRGDLDISLDWYRTGEMKTTIWQYASDNTVEAVAYGSSKRDMAIACIQCFLNYLKQS